jgi:DDE superfamily endonuclease
MAPLRRRTWGRRGMTPILHVRARSHEKVSGIGALIVSPRRSRITLALALHAKINIRGPQVLRFLRRLRRHVRGPVVLVWDLGNPHKHRLVRAWLARHPSWHVVWFPPYAPELNPAEHSGRISSTAGSPTSPRTTSTTSATPSPESAVASRDAQRCCGISFATRRCLFVSRLGHYLRSDQ